MKYFVLTILFLTLCYTVSCQNNIKNTVIEPNRSRIVKECNPDIQEVPDSLKHAIDSIVKKGLPVYGVDSMPTFPGGEDSLLVFIHKTLNYSNINQEIDAEGRVTIRFTISQTGEVHDVVVIRSLEPSYDREAVRTVMAMPNWIPGRQNGRTVEVYYTLPIVFRVEK